jgi:hypothetical protein
LKPIIENNMKIHLITLFLLLSFSGFSQTIGTSQIKDGAITEPKLAANALRPVDGGALSDPALVFGPDYRKKYTLSVTSDIALTLSGSTQTADSYIFISTVPDGQHVISFPSDWIKKNAVTFDPVKTQRIELYYDGSKVYIDIFNGDDIIISTLTSAVMTEGTDDLNLSFSNPVTITTAGWSVTASGGAATVSAVTSGSGTEGVVFDLSRNIASGETMSISYNPSTGATVSPTGNEIAAISNFFVDTGEETLPDNSITVDDSGGKDYTTITAGINAATTGQTVVVYAGTYRETPIGKNGVTVQPAPGETAIVSGLNLAGNTGWVLSSGNIYYKVIAPSNGAPTDGYSTSLTGNTTLLANQVFDEGVMIHDARWPNIDTPDDLMVLDNMRHRSETVNGFPYTSISDTGLPNSSSFSLVGAKLICFGWFWPHIRSVTTHSATTIGFSAISGNNSDGQKYRQWYYVTGKLGLLDVAKEWHYDPATDRLYVWQAGGGSPTNIEYKSRNWGFDLRGVSNFTIKGLHFIGCDPAHGDNLTSNVTIDNIRATYLNHDVDYPDNFPGYGNAVNVATTSGIPEMGTKLLGTSNTIKNSEFRYSASAAVWVGTSGLIQNNKFEDISYSGAWGAAASFSGLSDDVVIEHNTFARTGRSGVDMGYSYTGSTQPQNLNIKVRYNDFSGWCALNVDGGAIYSWGFRDLTGGEYDHNWFHDDGVIADPTGTKLDGGQRAVYFDQGTGPVTVHHNVFWNNFDVLPGDADMQDSQDIYSQMEFTGGAPLNYHRNTGGNFFYNNAIMSDDAHHSYATYETKGTKDVFINNEFNKIINLRWGLQGVGYAPNEHHNFFREQSTNQSAAALGTGSVENVDFDIYSQNNASHTFFLETGSGGLFYRLHASSPGRNAGAVIAGITDDDDGTPDIGPYKFADNADPWIPGYNAVALDEDVYIEDNNLTFTSYKVTGGTPFSPTVQTDAAYHGGTSSFFNTDEAYVEITIPTTATGFEWYAEKYNHSAIVEVQVDGVRQDCDAGTGGTQDCDLYIASTTKNSTLIFTKTGLGTSAQKVIKLINKSANGSSVGQFVIHDTIKILD